MKRRNFLKSTLAFSTSVAAGRTALEGREGSVSESKVFVLIHGAWHAALHWNKVVELLACKGHRVLALDLPGHGLKARYPTSFLRQDLTKLTTEESPVRQLTIRDYVDAAAKEVCALSTSKVVVVGHSMAGMILTQLGEKLPEKIERLVYLAAVCPAKIRNPLAFYELPEANEAHAPNILGDPAKIGAFRCNTRSTEPKDLEKLHQAFGNDMSLDEFLPFIHGLSPDEPMSPLVADSRGTSGRWGRIPRTYIRCKKDAALPFALQNLIIEQADDLAPDNKFHVETLDTSHSPFASQPKLLCDILDRLA